MKRLFYIVATLALFACEKAEDFGQQGGVASGADLPEVIYATVADDSDNDTTMTRTYANGQSILWNSGDAISLFTSINHMVKYQYDGEDGATTAEFSKVDRVPSKVDFEVSRSYAVYPYGLAGSCVKDNGVEKLKVFFSAEQTYAPNSFGKGDNVMVAVGEHTTDNNFYFRNACGYLVIKLYGEAGTKVEKIELTALGGEKIAGNGIVEPHYDAAPEVTMTDEGTSTIVLNCGDGVELGTTAQQATEFWFAMPPVTLEKGLKILVTPTEGGAFTVQTSNKVAITRTDIQPMAALKLTANTQSDHQLFYTRASSTQPLAFSNEMPNPFDATITKHYYDEEEKHFVIEFDRPLTTIGENAFSGSKIEELIGSFYGPPSNVTDITSVTFPKSLTTIGKFAFAGTALRELTIPGNVTQVGYYAFWECRELERISILEGDEPLMVVANAMASARSPFGFSPLRHIYIDRDIDYRDYDHYDDKILEGSFDYANVDEGLFSLSAVSEGGDNRPGIVDEVTVEIGPKLSQIYPRMFANRNIKTITIPGNVTHIGEEAFFSCDDLVSVTIPSSQTTIGRHAFWFCDGLKSVDFGSSIVNEASFSHCSVLESVTIRGTVESIGNDAFYNCKSLKSLTFEPSPTNTPLTLGYQTFVTNDQSPFYDASLETLNWNREINYTLEEMGTVDAVNEGLFAMKPNLTNVTIGEQVKNIPLYSFAESGMTSVTIPSSMTSIGNYAFYNCDDLISVNNNGTTSIGDYAFYECDELTSVTSSASLTSIGAYAFQNDDDLTTFTVAGSVGSIGVEAFEDCDALATLSITGSVGKVCSYAFSDCDVVTSLAICADEVESYAYEDMDGLTSATLYGATVGDYVFYDCDALQTLVIDGGVNSIGNNAFYGCGELKSVTFKPSPTNTDLTLGYQTESYGSIIDDRSPFYDCPLDHVDWNRNLKYALADAGTINGDDEGLFARKDDLKSVNIGTQVRTIPPYTFANAGLSGSVWIPHTVESIGEFVFFSCNELDGITMGYDGTTPFPTIGSYLFYDCAVGVTLYIKVRYRVHEQFVNAAKNNTSGWGEYGGNLRWDTNFN